MEQVWSRYELGLVRKKRIIRIKRKDNCYFSYEKKVYRGSGNMTHSTPLPRPLSTRRGGIASP